jgi:hypothetical protein
MPTRDHGHSALNGKFKIISKTVYARDLYTEGNSLEEWGYVPQPYFATAKEDAVKAKLGMKTSAERAAARAAKAQLN